MNMENDYGYFEGFFSKIEENKEKTTIDIIADFIDKMEEVKEQKKIELAERLKQIGQVKLSESVLNKGLPKQIITTEDIFNEVYHHMGYYCDDIICREFIDGKSHILFSWREFHEPIKLDLRLPDLSQFITGSYWYTKSYSTKLK